MFNYRNWRGWDPFRFWKNPAGRGSNQAARPVPSGLDRQDASKNWVWQTFRSVLIELSTHGAGHYIPSPKRPDFIHLDGLQKTFTELRGISSSHYGREVSRAVFVDIARGSLVISGVTHIGTRDHVKVDIQPERGREFLQIPVI